MSWSFKGKVTASGGGEVKILVDRDTESYPPVGSYVKVTQGHTRDDHPRLMDDTEMTAKSMRDLRERELIRENVRLHKQVDDLLLMLSRMTVVAQAHAERRCDCE